MTDIHRHLKGIYKILDTAFQHVDQPHTLDFDAILSALRAYLPKGYGIGSGQLVDAEGKSQPVQVLLYDIALAGEHYPQDSAEHPIKTALAVLDLAFIHTEESFTAALERIASVKRLQTLRQRSSDVAPSKPVGQSRTLIPKDRLPFALVYFDRLENKNDGLLYPALHALMQKYPAELLPDRIDIIGQQAQYLNPLLEKRTADPFSMSWSRTPDLRKANVCYVCKQKFLRQHFFYNQLCMECGDLNYQKRVDTVDLSGYRVLVTGARVKIGYAVALRLLRSGAEVIVTSRFPRDTARRFSEEPDFADWCERLHIYGLDLRQVSRLQAFIAYLEATYPHLDAIINNAAQTVKRPPAYYAHLIPFETAPLALLPPRVQALLSANGEDTPYLQPSIQAALTGDAADKDFPEGEFDQHGQQVDNRDFNSWVMRLEDVSPLELAEVHLVNAIAPAILTGQLKQRLLRSPHKARFIVNVSAAEGRFSQFKNGYHPHTNMAKAALNMLTRTIAPAYAADQVYVTSVDPGWVSDQTPRQGDLSRMTAEEKLPIDMIDAAARVCDPIFSAVKGASPLSGVFLKDYQITDW
jgi:NAD(P)-dependent dehydrogenase (short-subunit alcohol dehydrogenase family)